MSVGKCWMLQRSRMWGGLNSEGEFTPDRERSTHEHSMNRTERNGMMVFTLSLSTVLEQLERF